VRARESPGSANEVIAGFLPEVTLVGTRRLELLTSTVSR
jgi:hypothetical protein